MNKKVIASTIMLVASAMTLGACGCNSKRKTEGDKYTYRTTVSGNPNTWNPHEWETSDDSIILSFTTAGLYEFVFNSDRSGYEIVPEMAAGEPVDISSTLTAAEKARYGIDKDSKKGIKWAIDLREEATWEDGTPITADDYVYSMERILAPEMMNYRANSYYSGSVAIGNAKDYFNGGHEKYNNIAAGIPSIDGNKKYFSFFEPMMISKTWGFEGYSLYDWYHDDTRGDKFTKDYEGTGKPCSGYEALLTGEWGTVNAPKFVEVTSENKKQIEDFLNELFTVVAERDYSASYEGQCLFYHTGTYEKMDYDGADKAVGLVKTGDYQITIYTAAETTAFDFKYNFSSAWLVKKDLYEANYTQIGALTKTTYGTATDNYMGFGPYKLTEYQKDKIIHLSRNENYFGYKDESVIAKDEYQCTDVDIQIIPSQATQLMMFLKGELDDVSLQREDVNTYGASSRVRYSPNTYTSKVTFNTSWDKLVERQESGQNKDRFM